MKHAAARHQLPLSVGERHAAPLVVQEWGNAGTPYSLPSAPFREWCPRISRGCGVGRGFPCRGGSQTLPPSIDDTPAVGTHVRGHDADTSHHTTGRADAEVRPYNPTPRPRPVHHSLPITGGRGGPPLQSDTAPTPPFITASPLRADAEVRPYVKHAAARHQLPLFVGERHAAPVIQD